MKRYIIVTLLSILFAGTISAQSNTKFRRPISPDQPMWIIHIDTWNYPDPQKIIDLVPKDIRPYVVMNISLSVSHDENTFRFQRAEYGLEIAKSWLATCAENRMWAFVQPASGGYCHFPDGDLSIPEELFREFPNFLGLNYSEQFWGFDQDYPLSPKWTDRMSHFADLLELSNDYGGYLVVSICWNKWGPGVNPIGMLKRSSKFAAACEQYNENYLLFDKHTQISYLNDRESMCLGAYLSGYSGQYGIRYDDTGWTNEKGDHGSGADFTMATYGAPFLEHTMLTGLTMYDGPELIWTQCFKEVDAVSTTNSYYSRNWQTFPQFDNVSVDLFRKVLDGTVRIPTREEVIDRSKFVIIHDTNTGSDDNKYSSPTTLYEGLYQMNNDGYHGNNWSFFKKTGRYPAIPIVYKLNDDPANTFDYKINKSGYTSRWSNTTTKVNEFNGRFPEEYTGDLFAGRHENGWVVYNPFKTGQKASASIPFKYNTCEKMELTYSQYTAGVVKEYADYLTFYLSNFDHELDANLKPNVVKIYGSSSKPTYTVVNRGANLKSKVKTNWSDGVFTLTIEHNGPVDIRVNCAGNATDRLNEYKTANIVVPNSPPAYTGPHQYEAETFEYKNINGIVKNGYSGEIRNYTGQGYLNFGTSASAAARDFVTVLNDGIYELKTKYTVSTGNVTTIDLYVNGVNVATPSFNKTSNISDWNINTQIIELKKGENTIELKAVSNGQHTIYFDNFVIESNQTNGIWMEAECGNLGSLWNTNKNSEASNENYIEIQPGKNSTDGVPSNENGYVNFNFNIEEPGSYSVWARIKTPSSNDDSFWVRTDNGTWSAWNSANPNSDWKWEKLLTSTLTAGDHTISIAYSEDGAQLDKLFITKTDIVPNGLGGPGTNCSAANQHPIAFVGSDITLIDIDNDGKVAVEFSSRGSVDPDGTIVSYSWGAGVMELAQGANPIIELPVGVYEITLTVTDNQGAIDTDALTVTIYEGTYNYNTVWLEAECGTVGSNWDVKTDAGSSNGNYITVKAGIESTNQAPDTDAGLVKMSFNIVAASTYNVYARVNCPSADDDSYWVKMDNGSYKNCNGLTTNGWQWKKLNTYNLSAGEHTLSIGYREDGALLDKVFITKYIDEPTGLGDDATNCETGNSSIELVSMERFLKCYPNPFSNSSTFQYQLNEPGYVSLKIFNSNGQQVAILVNGIQHTGDHEVEWTPSEIPCGVYFYRIQAGRIVETQKIIYL